MTHGQHLFARQQEHNNICISQAIKKVDKNLQEMLNNTFFEARKPFCLSLPLPFTYQDFMPELEKYLKEQNLRIKNKYGICKVELVPDLVDPKETLEQKKNDIFSAYLLELKALKLINTARYGNGLPQLEATRIFQCANETQLEMIRLMCENLREHE